jgi:hypothetical protein
MIDKLKQTAIPAIWRQCRSTPQKSSNKKDNEQQPQQRTQTSKATAFTYKKLSSKTITQNTARNNTTKKTTTQPIQVKQDKHDTSSDNVSTTTRSPNKINEYTKEEQRQQQRLQHREYTQIKLKSTTYTNQPFGDSITDTPDHERILFHNINGMKDDKNWYQKITTMKEQNASIIRFAEINQSLNRGYKWEWHDTLRKIFLYSRTAASESNLQLESKYKPGGTMTIVTGKWQARVSELGQDPTGMGRWSYQKISSKKKSIIIAMAYQPCSSQGPSTAWMQQWVILRESGIRNPNPIQKFYHNLEEQLLQWTAKGHEIILMIDANKNIGDKPGGLTTIIGKTGLQDLVRCRHPNQPEPNTHSRGSTRIDYIFGTRKISDHCKKAGILPFNMGYMSDHRAIFVEIDIEAVLSTNVKASESITARKLQQATPKEREHFLQQLNSFLEEHSIYNRLIRLHDKTKDEWTEEDVIKYKHCDEILINGALQAEKRTRQLKTTPWSPKFAQAVNTKSFWKIALSLKCNCKQPNKEFLTWADNLAIINFKEMDIQMIKKQFRAAPKVLRKVEQEAEALREQHLRSMLTEAELNGDEMSIQKCLKI